jgi:hypothetical protein
MTEWAYCAGGKTITRLASERKRLVFRHGREGNAIASAGDRFKRQRERLSQRACLRVSCFCVLSVAFAALNTMRPTQSLLARRCIFC